VLIYLPLTDTNWHHYAAKFGNGTSHPFPNNARTMTVAAVINHNSINPGDTHEELTGLQILPAGRPPIQVFDNRAGCPPGGATAGTTVLMSTGSFTVPRQSTVTVSANILSIATGRRDVELRVDGNVQMSTLNRTEVRDFAPHHIDWIGGLSPGAHTIELRAGGNLTSPDGYGCGAQWGNLTVHFDD
jgi:hypothetical protein